MTIIDDPIVITEYPDDAFFKKYRDIGKTDCFYELRLSGGGGAFGPIRVIALIDTFKSTRSCYWFRFVVVSFKSKPSESYLINDTPYSGMFIKREQFIDRIRDEYPAYFEWFLFHPEHIK